MQNRFRNGDNPRLETENRREPPGQSLFTGTSQLQNQGVLWQIGVLTAEVLHLFFILISQIIESETVLLRVHNGHQLGLQASALSRVQKALKHGILYPLAVIHTFFRDLPQTLPPGGILCVHIISNQNQHSVTSIKKAGRHPDRPGCTGPAAEPVHRESGPSSFFRSDRDGSGCPASDFGSFSTKIF